MDVSVELILLGMAVLFFLSILEGKAGYKFGVPALLLFLSVGMFSGSDGLGIQFENIHLAQAIGTVALCIILFSGGMDTKFSDIKPVLTQGILLATLGVLLTAVLTGFAIWGVLGMTVPAAGIGLNTSLLLAATLSSPIPLLCFRCCAPKG